MTTFFIWKENRDVIRGESGFGETIYDLVGLTFVAGVLSGKASPELISLTDRQILFDFARPDTFDAALAGEDVGPDQRAQLEDMRNQAVQLCGAGNEAEGLDVTAEAKAMLNLQ